MVEHAAKFAEMRSRFITEARASRDEALKTGEGYDAAEVHAYLKARVAGEEAARPKIKAWRG